MKSFSNSLEFILSETKHTKAKGKETANSIYQAFNMEKRKKVVVLGAFQKYLRLLKVYNSENFKKTDENQFVRNVCIAVGATIVIGLIPIVVYLGIWYIFDSGATLRIIVIAMPVIISIVQLLISLIALISENRGISEMIERIQTITNERKCCT